MGKTERGPNSKREAGNLRKAENAAKKAQAARAQEEAEEAEKWTQGTKKNVKQEVAAAKKAEQARKKAERDALLAEEDRNTPGRSTPKNSKQAQKKSRGLDLNQLDADLSALNASGIDNALDALEITSKADNYVDRHPERRYPAAYAKFEARRLEEVKEDGSMDGLRLDQKKQRIKKEFDKSDENPFNQMHAAHNATREELAEMQQEHRDRIEARLTNS